MGASVRLDYSSWDAEALERLSAIRERQASVKARKAAAAAHPLAGVLGQLSEASEAVSGAERWRFVSRDFGNGHREAVVARVIPHLQRDLERATTPRGESDDREGNVERAARRAKQRVRHLSKALGINALWTLTYRANVQDRDLVLKHFDAFRRRVGAVLGDWRYVAVLERQERGAWHVHMGTHKLPRTFTRGGHKVKSWDLLRSIWRSVTGELGGNFDEAQRSKRWGGKRSFTSAASIARYIAAYVGKDMLDAGLNRKRFSASKGVDVPPAYRVTFDADEALSGLIELAYAAVGDRITSAWFDRERGVFFVESDDSGPLG